MLMFLVTSSQLNCKLFPFLKYAVGPIWTNDSPFVQCYGNSQCQNTSYLNTYVSVLLKNKRKKLSLKIEEELSRQMESSVSNILY